MRTTLLMIGLLLTACGGPGILNAGPGTYVKPDRAIAPGEGNLLAQALTPITIEVSPENILTHRFQEAIVVAHLKPGPADEASRTWTLQLQIRQGAIVNIRYTAPGGLLLPVSPGQRLVARIYRSNASTGPDGVALILRDPSGSLLAALVTNLDLSADGLETGLDVHRSDRLAYQTISRTEALCVVLTEHYATRFHSEDQVLYLRPGERSSIEYRGTSYDAVALEAAVHTHQTCAVPRQETMSYALMGHDAAKPSEP